ncbi:MAG TPA: hypothetical protein VFU15_11225 [Bacteroidia bacterium]|nr:hypothetical protein [Bacteroidia bacterium]
MALKIMMWNIEQFGTTRCKYPNRVDRISDIVAHEKPDVFVTLEVRTKDPADAIDVADKIKNGLYNNHNLDYQYILTHYSFFEYYAYFYLDTVVPYTVATGGSVLYDYSNSLQNLTLVRAGNRLSTTNATVNNGTPLLKNHFPLLDYPGRAPQKTNEKNRRPPGAGFFKTTNSNEYFAVITWHNETATQIKRKRGSEKGPMMGKGVVSMQRIAKAGFVQNSNLIVQVKENGTTSQRTFDQVIFTGDFNNDPTTNKNDFTGLGTFSHMVTNPTHIHNYVDDEGEEFNELIHCLDNSLQSQSLAQNNNIKTKADVFSLNLWLKDKKPGNACLKKMLQESWLGDKGALHRLAKEDALRGLDHYCDKRKYGTVYKEYKDEIIRKILNQNLKAWVNKSQTKQTQQTFINDLNNNILANLQVKNRSSEEMTEIRKQLAPVAGEVATIVKDYAKNFCHIVKRYELIKKNPDIIKSSEALFLIRMILSDHLPVITTISNW